MSPAAESPTRAPAPLQLCVCSAATVRVLVAPLRRVVLCALLTSGASSVDELTALVATTTMNSVPDGLDSVGVALKHVHLPKLASAGLVSVDWTDGSLTVGSHPDIREGTLTPQLLGTVEQALWTAVAAVNRDPRRPAVLELVARTPSTLTLTDLTERLTGASARTTARAATARLTITRDHLAAALHHVHLPALDEVGLLAYDPSTHTVSSPTAPVVELPALVDALDQ